MTMIVQEEINFLSIEIHCKEYVCGLNGKISVLFLFFFILSLILTDPRTMNTTTACWLLVMILLSIRN